MEIKIYGADWCSDCIVVKKYLDERNIPYEYIIITENKKARRFVENNKNGKRIIPTIVIDGKAYSNPGIVELIRVIEE